MDSDFVLLNQDHARHLGPAGRPVCCPTAATAAGMGDQGAQKGHLPNATRIFEPGGIWLLSLEHPGSLEAHAATAMAAPADATVAAAAAPATVAAVVEVARGPIIRLDPGRDTDGDGEGLGLLQLGAARNSPYRCAG
jgi:hypothetical protein